MKSSTAFPFLFKRKIPFKDSYGEAQTEKTQRKGMRVEERETFAELAPPQSGQGRHSSVFLFPPTLSPPRMRNAEDCIFSTPPYHQPGCLFKMARVSVLNCFSRPVCSSVPRSCKAQGSQRGDIIPKPPGHILYSAFWRTRAGR